MSKNIKNLEDTIEINIDEINIDEGEEAATIIRNGEFLEEFPKYKRIKDIKKNNSNSLKLFTTKFGFKGFFKNIARTIKKAYQRCKYGVADDDVREFSSYLNVTIENGLKTLSKNIVAIPTEMSDDDWVKTLSDMVRITEYLNYNNIDNLADAEYNKFRLYEDIYGGGDKETSDALEEWLNEEEKIRKHFDDVHIKMYCKLAMYYKNLWY